MSASSQGGGDYVSKARLIYFAVFAILIFSALLPAFFMLFDGAHDGNEI
jgi:hypothetical protein